MTTSRRKWLSGASLMMAGVGSGTRRSSQAQVLGSETGCSTSECLNVLNFGAIGNGATDDSPAFQAAIDAAPTYGAPIYVPPKSSGYVIGNLKCGLKAIEWIGGGGPGQSIGLGHGAVELIVKEDTIGIVFGDGHTNSFRGPVLKNLRLVAQSPKAVGGLLFLAVSNARADNVVCSNFTGPNSYGWKFDGRSASARFPSATMYNDLYGCGANNCAVGMWGTNATGLRVFGGLFDANDNRANHIVSNTTGMLWQFPGDTLGVFGTRFQSYGTHIYSSCPGTFISGTRHEAFTKGIVIAGDFCTVMPSEMDNSFAGGGGTAVYLESGKNCFVLGNAITSVSTRINRGKATKYIIIDRGTIESNYSDGTSGLLLGGEVNLFRPEGSANVLRTDNQFRAGDGIVTKVVAGAISDENFQTPPPDGVMAIDSLHKRIYIRVNGSWLFKNLDTL